MDEKTGKTCPIQKDQLHGGEQSYHYPEQHLSLLRLIEKVDVYQLGGLRQVVLLLSLRSGATFHMLSSLVAVHMMIILTSDLIP